MARSPDTVILNVYGSGKGSFDLYDEGISLAYAQGQYPQIPVTYARDSGGSHQLVVEPTSGSFKGQV